MYYHGSECWRKGQGVNKYSNEGGNFRMRKIYITALSALSIVLVLSLGNYISYAEEKDEVKKIESEKTEVLGVLEKPAVVFPVRWKYPEGRTAKTVILERSFDAEIYEFVDMEKIAVAGIDK